MRCFDLGRRPGRGVCWGWVVVLGGLIVGLGGCQAVNYRDPSLEQPAPPALEPPREKAMQSLPAYRIEPPDIIQIELMKLVPRPPYHIEAYDVLQISVIGALPEFPINGYYLVEAEGEIDLGPAYGAVRVMGLTPQQAETVVTRKLREILAHPQVSVQLARASGMQPITGPYLVGPDGTVNLRQYGSVHVAGKTVFEARLALEQHLKLFLDSPEVSVDLAAYNSKVYYVITEGSSAGDNIVRIPITGNETVLDAISQIQGLSQLSSKNIWIARPAPGGFGCEQILPVDYIAITRGGMTATNYQLMPGDRVFIAEDPVLAFAGFLNRLTTPVERVLGIGSLTSSTVRGFQLIGYRRTYY